tara:strand:- start:26 stop:142 length:117 start_codon:yes stop_codon:yes gene_type:complete
MPLNVDVDHGQMEVPAQGERLLIDLKSGAVVGLRALPA